MKRAIVLNALGFVTALLISGCGIKNAVDCDGICNRYQSCFDSSYDTGACESRCRDNADKDDDFASKVDDCHNCIDDKSCASATFNCGTPCANIVP
jgi:hypothetical protein